MNFYLKKNIFYIAAFFLINLNLKSNSFAMDDKLGMRAPTVTSGLSAHAPINNKQMELLQEGAIKQTWSWCGVSQLFLKSFAPFTEDALEVLGSVKGQGEKLSKMGVKDYTIDTGRNVFNSVATTFKENPLEFTLNAIIQGGAFALGSSSENSSYLLPLIAGFKQCRMLWAVAQNLKPETTIDILGKGILVAMGAYCIASVPSAAALPDYSDPETQCPIQIELSTCPRLDMSLFDVSALDRPSMAGLSEGDTFIAWESLESLDNRLRALGNLLRASGYRIDPSGNLVYALSNLVYASSYHVNALIHNTSDII